MQMVYSTYLLHDFQHIDRVFQEYGVKIKIERGGDTFLRCPMFV